MSNYKTLSSQLAKYNIKRDLNLRENVSMMVTAWPGDKMAVG
jgi:hypothetical protein